MKRRQVKVSNHALLRYLERVGGFDIEGLRQAIEKELSGKTSAGASAIILDGHRYVIRTMDQTQVVVTVIPVSWPHGESAGQTP